MGALNTWAMQLVWHVSQNQSLCNLELGRALAGCSARTQHLIVMPSEADNG